MIEQERHAAPVGCEFERVYNGRDGLLAALERGPFVERRRLWPGRRASHHAGGGGAILGSAVGSAMAVRRKVWKVRI